MGVLRILNLKRFKTNSRSYDQASHQNFVTMCVTDSWVRKESICVNYIFISIANLRDVSNQNSHSYLMSFYWISSYLWRELNKIISFPIFLTYCLIQMTMNKKYRVETQETRLGMWRCVYFPNAPPLSFSNIATSIYKSINLAIFIICTQWEEKGKVYEHFMVHVIDHVS